MVILGKTLKKEDESGIGEENTISNLDYILPLYINVLMVCSLHKNVTKIGLRITYHVERATFSNADFELFTRARQATYQRVKVAHKTGCGTT